MAKAKYKKMTKKQKKLSSKFIAEEMKVKKRGKRKYPRKQAIAIGISRARSATKKRSGR